MIDLSGEAIIYWDGTYEGNDNPTKPDEMAGLVHHVVRRAW